MCKNLKELGEIRKSVWIALALLLVFSLLQNAAGSTYYSLLMQSSVTVTSPLVKLENGTAGNSTIYGNSTSAKVRVAGQGDFNYVLKLVENENSNWKIRFSGYNEFNITRLTNCTIYLRNGLNSSQIVIFGGDYGSRIGPWYDLAASSTEYIWMHVNASDGGTSYIYTYLEILVPDTTVCARYIITFEVTQ